jgi:hypothetical protein
MNDTTDLTIADVMAGYEALNAFLADHPDLPPAAVNPYYIGTVRIWLHRSQFDDDQACRAEFVRCARALMAGAPIGSVEKSASDTAQTVRRKFGPVTLAVHASRDAVCTKRVIGTEKVTVPDPTAPTVEIEREIVEWICEPILPAEQTAEVPA